MPGDVKQEPAEVAEARRKIPLPRPGREDAGMAVAGRKPSSSWERLTALILKEFLQIWRIASAWSSGRVVFFAL